MFRSAYLKDCTTLRLFEETEQPPISVSKYNSGF